MRRILGRALAALVRSFTPLPERGGYPSSPRKVSDLRPPGRNDDA